MVVRIFARALAEFMSNDKSAVVSRGRTVRRNALGSAVRRRPSTNGSLAVRVVVLAVALDLALVSQAQSQMPLALPDPPAVDGPAIATDARLAGDDKQTRLVIDISHKIDMRAFALADPYRVVIEIPQVDFRLPPDTGEHGRGIIKAFRYGLVMSGQSRIVLDLTGPVRVTKAFVLDPVDGQPARMVLDLIAVDRDTFLRAAAIDNHLPRPAERGPAHFDREEHTTDSRPVVVLDAGHGGIDPGTRAPSGELEKDLVLEFASTLRAKLEATGKYRVMMTRTDDTFVELSERVRFARQQQAQLLISIHCDALARGEGEAEGATVYTLSDKASDSSTSRNGRRERSRPISPATSSRRCAARRACTSVRKGQPASGFSRLPMCHRC